jgi:hypothetical protein
MVAAAHAVHRRMGTGMTTNISSSVVGGGLTPLAGATTTIPSTAAPIPDSSAIIAALEGANRAVQALVAVLTAGAGAAPGTGAALPATTTTPMATSMPGMDMPGMDMTGATGGGADAAPASGDAAMKDMPGMHHGSGAKGTKDMKGMDHGSALKMPTNPGKVMKMGKHGMAMKMRSEPINEKKAAKLATAVTEFYSDVKKSQVDPGKNKTDQHYSIPKKMRKRFEKEYPGLKSPTTLVIDKKTDKPFGVMYMGDKKDGPSLPAGNSHRHKDGGAFMQHVWFTPNDLGLAYGDIQAEGKAKKAVLGVGGGGGHDAGGGHHH